MSESSKFCHVIYATFLERKQPNHPANAIKMLFHKSLYKKTFVLTVDNKKGKVLLLDVQHKSERNIGGYAVILGNPKDLDDDEITFEKGEGPTSIETNGKYFLNKKEVTTNDASSDATEKNLNLEDFEIAESSEHPSRQQNFRNQPQRKSKQQSKSTKKTPLRRSRRLQQRN